MWHNNLVYHSSTTSTYRVYGVGTYDAATFNAYNADISGNTEGDPLLNVDYTIQDASPAVNAGTTALATVDYFGNTVPYLTTNPDIGIHETNVESPIYPLGNAATPTDDVDSIGAWTSYRDGTVTSVGSGDTAAYSGNYCLRLDAVNTNTFQGGQWTFSMTGGKTSPLCWSSSAQCK